MGKRKKLPTNGNKEIVQELFTKFVDLSRQNVKENSHQVLLEKTLFSAMELTHADAGTFYIVDGDELKFEIVVNKSLDFHLGGTSNNPVMYPDLPLYVNKQPNVHNVACCCVIENKVINVDDAYQSRNYDFSGTRTFDRQSGYRSKSFLTIPLKSHENEIIGVLQLINAQNEECDEVIPFGEDQQMYVEFLASQAAITLSNYNLIQDQKKLFESFIDLISTAIDDKSPYTGGHCQRVPVLSMMIADAAKDATWGPFKEFHPNKEEYYELKIAAMLHDCGKITTPVHVIDKATKLETIYDRIDTVDTRFEVVKRDRKIEFLEQKMELMEKGKLTEFNLRKLEKELDKDVDIYNENRDLLREYNYGQEFMSDDKLEKIREIGKLQWVNADGVQGDFLTYDELLNLTIRKGTLSDGEREVINHHIELTIEMLNKLPYPKNLRNVPEFAGGHHERMDGKGYPLGLTRDEMSLQARMIGVADIFEALTAVDRPYKKGKTLSESLNILKCMKDENHIDPDIFELFIESKIYLSYAEKFLRSEQIDDINIEDYLETRKKIHKKVS
jgi:HD-GYP domain-containing protein (c-di-GMP phosphodiesterase class II)